MFKPGFYIVMVGVFVTNIAIAQVSYAPSNYLVPPKEDLFERIRKEHVAKKGNLPVTNRKEYESIYQEKYDTLVHHLKQKHYLFDNVVSPYYTHIVEEIVKANPALSEQAVRLLISRRADPNASSMGYGIITLHIGLSRRFENESQAAFILCHELAHHYLNHVDLGIANYVESMYGKSTQRQVSKIVNSDTQKVSRAMDLLRSTVYENNRHSRLYERAADSLGLLFLKRTKYDEREALTALALLDSVDMEKYRFAPPLKQFFDAPQYPFKDAWLKPSSLLRLEDDEQYWNKDSLKTHPACNERISYLSHQLSAVPAAKKKFLQSDSLFREMITRSDFELIEREWHFQRYGKCLYESLLLLKQHPHNTYLQGVIGQCLYGIYTAQKNHQLSRHVELPAPGQSKEYRQLLDFLHNLRLKEISQLGFYFLKNNYSPYSTEEFLYAFAGLSKVVEATEELTSLKKDYLQKYPNGKYVQQLKQF